MYVDKKRSGEQQVDTRSDLERFIAWAKTRDPEETYHYTLPSDCVIARWDKSEGRTEKRYSFEVTALFGGNGHKIAFYGGPTLSKRTIKGALAAALKVQKEQ